MLILPKNLSPKIKKDLKQQFFPLCLSIFLATFAGISSLYGFWKLLAFVDSQNTRHLLFCILSWVTAGGGYALSSYYAHTAELNFAQKIRLNAAQHIAHLPSTTLARYGNTELKSLLTTDVYHIHYLIAHFPSEFVCFIIVPSTSVYFLITLIGLKSLFILTPALIASLYYLIVVPYTNARDGEARMQVIKNIISIVDDYFKGIKVQRIYGSEKNFIEQYKKESQKFTTEMLTWVKKVATLSAIATSLLQAVATFTITYLLTYKEDYITIFGSLFFSLAFVIPVLRLGHGLDYVSLGKAAFSRLNDLLLEETISWGEKYPSNMPEGIILSVKDACIQVQNKTLIKNFNQTFVSGEITTISAPSGTGKTTLLKALAGVQPLSSGCIKMNGISIHQLSEDFFYSTVLHIPQNIQTTETSTATIEEYLRVFFPNFSNDNFTWALNKAMLFCSLTTKLKSLSGGELQRLALSKVFLTKSKLILLDEPTSNLDEETAMAIMTELCKDIQATHKTLIIISHSPSIIAMADHQITLGNT
ncbi:ABC transporter [Pelistega indica]|uniref:ABC transporter n=1 Tax=Pelistega indica TaxID=1414851 RepID=V8FTP7_9BURK|nr:ABC transporter ATP-binding protein [Pelistega indica]ETD67664.1 ABC transporter [Pelistega indica]